MRDPYDVLGVSKNASAAAIKSAFRQLAKKLHPDANKHDKKAATRFAELNAAYEIVGDEDKRKAFDRGEIDAEGKPRFQGFEGFGGRARGAAAASARTAISRPSPGARDGVSALGRPRRGGGFGGFEDILKEVFGGAAAPARRRGGFRVERNSAEGSAAGRDVTGAVTITLPEAAKGVEERVQLPTGKEIDVKIPGRPRRRPDHPAEGAGACRPGRPRRRRADHGVDRAASAVRARRRRPAARAADHALRGGARRQGAGADARRRGRACDPGRHQCGPHVPPQGQGLAGQGRHRRSLATVRIVLPEGGDAELEELMRKWRDGEALRSARAIYELIAARCS